MFKDVKRFLLLSYCLLLILCLVGCGEKEVVEPEVPQEIQLYETIKTYATNPYHENIRQSRIVSPYAVINSFTRDFNEAAVEFNDIVLAVEIKIDDIKEGRLYIDNGDGTGTTVNGYYCIFDEGFSDEAIEKCRTSLIIPIHKDDYYLVKYGRPFTFEIDHGNGMIEPVNLDTAITKFFLIGKINKVVGDRQSAEDKINIIINDARLMPATTYQELYSLEQEQAQGSVFESAAVLDTNSGENITQKTYTFHFGRQDYDEDGICDDLITQVDEFSVSSNITKLLNSNIYNKIKTPVQSLVQIMFNGKETTSNKFTIPFPLKLKSLTAGQCTGFNGTYVDYVKIDLSGFSRQEFFNNDIDMKSILNSFPLMETEEFLLESKTLMFGINREKAETITATMLNGEVESLSTPKHLWLKNINIKMNGYISGEVYYMVDFPTKMIYIPELRFFEDNRVKELISKNYEFYDYDTYVATGELLKVGNINNNFNLISNKNIYISSQKYLLENVEIKSSYGADVEQGTGYYYYEDSYGDLTLGNCSVFYTGNQRFKIISLSKDEKDDNLYWLQVKSNKGYSGYIPVKMDGAWCDLDTNYAYYDTTTNKNYYLFGDSGIFSIVE